MSKVSREKEKRGIRSEISRDNYLEGTAARTRPISYDEILLSRKKKKLSGDFKVASESIDESGKDNEEHVFDRFEPDKVHQYNEDYLPLSLNHMEGRVLDGRSQKERRTTSIKEESLGTRIDKVSNEVKMELKAKLDKDRSSEAKVRTDEKLGHRQRIDGKGPRADSRKEVERNRSSSPLDTNKETDLSGRKSVRERDRKDRNRDDETHKDMNVTKKHEFKRLRSSDYTDQKDLNPHHQESWDKKTQYKSRDRGERNRRSPSISPKERSHTSSKDKQLGDQAAHPHYQESRDEKERYRSRDLGNRDRMSCSTSPKEQGRTYFKGNEHGNQTSHLHYQESRDRKGQYRNQYRGDKDRRFRSSSPKKQRHASSKGNEHGEQASHRSRYRGDIDRRSRSISPKEQRHTSSKGNEHGDQASRRSRYRGDKDRESRSISPTEQRHTSSKGNGNGEQTMHPLKDVSGKKISDVENSRMPSNGSSNHYNRNGGFKFRLGGYSPRKRRTEVGVRTPSPTARSPEKKRAGWDLPPAGTDNSESLPSNLKPSDPTISLHVPNLTTVAPLNISLVNSFIKVPNTLTMKKNSDSTDSVQLTQATQPLRRLYVENVPASASEMEVMECFNKFLLSSGGMRVRGTQPCISCIINKEKGLALVEFLTPEDASAALCFDGHSFFSSILKITRPNNFSEVATGAQEKSTADADAICDTVVDSPHKIFIGGISKVLTSEMIMEIAGVFGTLKAYHFQVNEDLDEQYAFLEYVDHLVTPKACCGLNGMKLGGKVLTAVEAFPNALISENDINLPFHQIPEHAKPLLEKPTEVLKLKNVFDLEGLSSLSEADLEETFEDVRLECARFGIVKSINIVKQKFDDTACTVNTSSGDSIKVEANAITNHSEHSDGVNMDRTEVLDGMTEGSSKADAPSSVGDAVQDKGVDGLQPMDVGSVSVCVSEEPCKSDPSDVGDAVQDVIEGLQPMDVGSASVCVSEEPCKSKPTDLMATYKLNTDLVKHIDNKEQVCNLEQIFQLGCIFVEYGRTEASCSAAHGLHGRLFDDRVISVQYIPLDIYQTRFPK